MFITYRVDHYKNFFSKIKMPSSHSARCFCSLTIAAGVDSDGVWKSPQWPQVSQVANSESYPSAYLFFSCVAIYQGSSLPLVKKMLVPWLFHPPWSAQVENALAFFFPDSPLKTRSHIFGQYSGSNSYDLIG